MSIGFGTAHLYDSECVDAVTQALEVGYRHIDTAQMYKNEEAVGRAIRETPVPRQEIEIATKVDPENLAYRDVIDSTKSSLERLGVETLDILYIHWPTHEYEPEESLQAFDELSEQGLVQNVGVCNFLQEQLEEAVELLDAPLEFHQIEHHPLLPQDEQLELCSEHDVQVVGFSPLARGKEIGKALSHPAVQEVADQSGLTPGQVCLTWAIDRGVMPIPKATGDHIKENYQSVTATLDENHRQLITEIEDRWRTDQSDPDWAPWN
jgi:2,5-diketo-D-gluconate reductase B